MAIRTAFKQAGDTEMTETRKRINYTVACVSEFAKRYGISSKEAFQFLYEYKAIEFLMGEFCYEQQK